MRVTLKVAKGASAGKVIEVKVPQFVIGRSNGCQLRPQSDAISRQHCVIQMKPEGPTVRDLGSRNGTLVNGEVTQGETALFTGDEVRVGPLVLEVTLLTDQGDVISAEALKEKLAAAQAPPAPVAPKPAAKPARLTSDSGIISDWLLEEEETEQKTGLTNVETRQFKIEETDRIEIKKDGEAGVDEAAADDEAGKADKDKNDKNDKKKKKEPGKLPERKGEAAANSREAAEQTLRKMFNRGL